MWRGLWTGRGSRDTSSFLCNDYFIGLPANEIMIRPPLDQAGTGRDLSESFGTKNESQSGIEKVEFLV